MTRPSRPAFALLIALVTIQAATAQIQGQWAKAGSMQSAREFHSQARIASGKVLTAGGIDASGNVLASAEVFTSSSATWASTGSMAEARQSFAAVTLANGKVLVSGGLGISGVVLGSAELFDPASGSWSPAGSLSLARYGHTATLLTTGKVLVTGGCTAASCTAITAVSELYDPSSNTWSTTGSLNTARSYQTALILRTGMVLAIGGMGPLTSCELYNPSKGTWSNAASLNTGRYQHTSTILADGKVLVAGGANGRFPITSAEIYTPSTNTWALTGSMTIGRYAHAASLLPDGTVLVAGGIGQSISCGKDCTSYIPTNKVDLFTESTGLFAATASLSQSLAYHEMTLLASGRALEDGGSATTSVCCTVVNTATVYTPLTLTFSATSLNFGLLQIGLSSTPQTVTVTNVSSHSVAFSSIASSGDYSQTNSCPATMTAGQSCTITVTFSPTVAGTRKGAVALKDNCPGSPVQTISLTGTGEALALGFTPSALNLGSVVVGSQVVLPATLTNDGGVTVNITGISIAPANGVFTETNNCPATLGVQQSCTFQITFTPPDVFTYKATLTVMNSAGAAATLALQGTGLNN